ncbi:AAA family ATPase [Parasedimentitalea maritima]|nr:AAA family ATPase [Zongyanglinia marina]
MTDGFELVSAVSPEKDIAPKWRPNYSKISKERTLNFGTSVRSPGTKFSVVLGKNGEGKSRALSDIAQTFRLMEGWKKNGGEVPQLPLNHLSYRLGGSFFEIQFEKETWKLLKDKTQVPLEKVALPRKVIAHSMTPFDKFPLRRQRMSREWQNLPEQELYSYTGIRDDFGGGSTTSMITRTVDSLVQKSLRGDHVKLQSVFSLLGFKPTITIIWRMGIRRALSAFNEGKSLDEVLSLMPSTFKRQYDRSRWNDVRYAETREAFSVLAPYADDRYLYCSLDVLNQDVTELKKYSAAMTLRGYGSFRMAAAEISKVNGEVIDLQDASSGELNLALTFISLASVMENDSLIMIDEPETNLHPEWQSKYIDLLRTTFSGYSGCHFILATHSPMVLSDLPETSNVAVLNSQNELQGISVSGKSIDYLLVEAFNVASGENYYLTELLEEALALAARGETKDKKFKILVDKLVGISPPKERAPGIAQIIVELNQLSRRIQSL